MASVVASVLTVSVIAAVPHVAPAAAADPSKGPVVIISGTFGSEPIVEVELRSLRLALAADGYHPYIYYLPGGGIGDMRVTAAGLVDFVDSVLASSGATEVDVIGMSQGGLLGRYFVKHLGGDAVVDTFVSLAAPHYGMPVLGLTMLLGPLNCLTVPVCVQLQPGSAFLADLNAGDDTPGEDVRYVSFASRFDEAVLPFTNAFLHGDDNTNVLIQDQCPLRIVEHVFFPQDGTVYSGIVDALADRPVTLRCLAL
jgi:triacylglycerol lipase